MCVNNTFLMHQFRCFFIPLKIHFLKQLIQKQIASLEWAIFNCAIIKPELPSAFILPSADLACFFKNWLFFSISVFQIWSPDSLGATTGGISETWKLSDLVARVYVLHSTKCFLIFCKNSSSGNGCPPLDSCSGS